MARLAISICGRFEDNEKTVPTILTTSQKLSSGVDVRNVRNIVLMRPVFK
jgi:type I restriction enzyme R subunit